VEIKPLTVSGKQVTLAVFRQLPEQPLVFDDGTLAGQPWGIVNYHPDKCAGFAAHWHVVWQDGDDLRRSMVGVKPTFGKFQPDEADHFVASCVYDVLVTGATHHFEGDPPLRKLLKSDVDGMMVATAYDFPTVMVLSAAGRAAVNASNVLNVHQEVLRHHRDQGWDADQRRQADEHYAATMAAFADEIRALGATTDELFERYVAAVEHERHRRDRHIAARDVLGQLPQLFIAV
jgi:hypothetical protein